MQKIWNLVYRRTSNYQPRTEIPKDTLAPEFINLGGGPSLPLEDATPDGGANLRGVTKCAGRRIRPEAVPPKLTWMSKRTPTDFQWTTVYSVSDRLKALIEHIEPGVHQFEPLQLVTKRGELMEDRWFWQICTRLDSVDPHLSTYSMEKSPYFYSATEKGQKYVIDPAKAGNAHFWRDKHLIDSIILCSNHAKDEMEKAKISGTVFHEVETTPQY